MHNKYILRDVIFGARRTITWKFYVSDGKLHVSMYLVYIKFDL